MVKLVPSSEDVRVYEIAVMFQPDLTQSQENAMNKELDEIFGEAKAKLLFKDPWTKRGLAYKIKGYSEAKFCIYYFEIEPAKMREMDNALRLQKNVLRHLIVIPPKGYEAVSWEAKYQDWITHRETITDKRTREKEEKVQKNVIEKAKRESKRSQEKVKAAPKAAMEMGKLSASLDKLISDEDLTI